MFGEAPQLSGWLKKRQTRKRATSATEHVQFKKIILWMRGLYIKRPESSLSVYKPAVVREVEFGEGKGVKEQLCDQPFPGVSGVARAAIWESN